MNRNNYEEEDVDYNDMPSEQAQSNRMPPRVPQRYETKPVIKKQVQSENRYALEEVATQKAIIIVDTKNDKEMKIEDALNKILNDLELIKHSLNG